MVAVIPRSGAVSLCDQHARPLSDVSREPRAFLGERGRMLQPRRRLGLVSQDKIHGEGNMHNRRFPNKSLPVVRQWLFLNICLLYNVA